MADVVDAHERGGRFCASFDAGIVLRELRGCGREDLAATWLRIASDGYCTMNADLGAWEATSAEGGAGSRATLSLKHVAVALQIHCCDALFSQHHDAGADAMYRFDLRSCA